jgi:hypothetical protein
LWSCGGDCLMKTRSIIITVGVAAFLLFVIASAVKDIPDLINFYNNGKIASGQFLIQAAYGKSQNFQDFKEDLNIIQANEATDNPTLIYEDQYEICNFESVCTVVNIDDSMGDEMQKELQYRFNHDLDTYSKIQALDEECRDNYHSFCFGEAWNSLTEFLN